MGSDCTVPDHCVSFYSTSALRLARYSLSSHSRHIRTVTKLAMCHLQES